MSVLKDTIAKLLIADHEENEDGSFSFTLTDEDGAEHRYRYTFHPATQGLAVTRRFVGVIGGIVAASQGGGDLAEQIEVLLDDDTVRNVLRYTSRDNEALVRNGGHTLAHEKAYRGNYGELLEAATEVVRGNRFLPLHRLLAKLPSALQARVQTTLAPDNGDDASASSASANGTG